LNEIGITNRLLPVDNTSNGAVVNDGVADPEDEDNDVDIFARFMRSTGVPPREAGLAATPDARAGEALFRRVGCVNCHVPTIVTSPAGTSLHGGSFVVPAALGDKAIHPYSDFLLHDVGTGDGIVQNGGPATRNKIRTPPLWGVRSRPRLMHDAVNVNRNEAILRHAGEAFARHQQLPTLEQCGQEPPDRVPQLAVTALGSSRPDATCRIRSSVSGSAGP